MYYRISMLHAVCYASPVIATHFIFAPISILQGVYAKYFGLPLTTIATVILLSRLFDAISDPIIGYFSDRYRAKSGTRKPFVIMGGLLLIVSSYFLYVPPENVDSNYFFVWFLAFYLAWTLFEIPHLAWGGELSLDSSERTKVYMLRTLGVYLGSLIFFIVPLLPIFDTAEVTPETLRFSTLFLGVIFLPLLFICVRIVPNGYDPVRKSIEKPRSLRSTSATIFSNRPLLLFLASYFFIGAGGGMWFSLLFIFIDGYLGMGEKVSFLFFLGSAAAMIAAFLWYKISIRIGKRAVWGLGSITLMISTLCLAQLSATTTSFYTMAILMIAAQMGIASMVVAPSLLSDIADYGRWKFSIDNAGMYFSMFTLVAKANIGVGGALALSVAGSSGFDPTVSIQSDAGVFGLRLAIGYIPAVLIGIALCLIALTPIDARRHRIISRRLEARRTGVRDSPQKPILNERASIEFSN